MAFRFAILLVALSAPSLLAQQKARSEVALGYGADVIYSSTPFKNGHNVYASVCYGLTDQWGALVGFDRHVYRLDRFHSNDLSFLGGVIPDLRRTVTSLLLGGRYFIPTESKVADLYVTLALGFARSSSSADGYYLARWSTQDTVFNRVESNQYLMGFLSFGAQVRPVSFLVLFADLQTSVAFTRDPFMGPIAAKCGIGVPF